MGIQSGSHRKLTLMAPAFLVVATLPRSTKTKTLSNTTKRRNGPQVLHVCSICNSTANSRYLLKRHFSAHDNEQRTCHECGLIFQQEWSYHTHRLHAHNNFTFSGTGRLSSLRRFKCSDCEKFFCSKGPLLRHLELQHRVAPVRKEQNRWTLDMLQCGLCNATFSQPSVRQIHEKDFHSESRRHMCIECGKMFRFRPNLHMHEKTKHLHKGNPQFICSSCGTSFTLKSSLRRHQISRCKSHKMAMATMMTNYERK
mmetsp:Transcript_12682/g.17704  ORF Transcript_12682/g.17704 Transcript_12682/m.17704 type:complete len:255 (-) Transcript_12682:72-836(-)